MNILVDTDVLLDLFLNREPFSETAQKIWNLQVDGEVIVHVSAITPINVFYIVNRMHDRETAHYSVNAILKTFHICTVTQTMLIDAANSSFSDFEDAVQYMCALEYKLDFIVTRNIKDYKETLVPVLLPNDFLAKLDENKG